MADLTVPVGGNANFLLKYSDLGSSAYAPAVSLASLLAGEDQVNNRLKVEMQPADTDSVLETLQNAVTSAGTGTAISTKGYKGLTFRVVATSGTWNGGMQATIDDTNWYYVQLTRLSDGTNLPGSATQFNPVTAVVDDLFTLSFPNIAISQVRFNFAVRTSGTLTVTSRKAPR